MGEPLEIYGPIHYLDAARVMPLCTAVDSRMWSWTSIAATVTCRRCRALLDRAAEALAASARAAQH